MSNRKNIFTSNKLIKIYLGFSLISITLTLIPFKPIIAKTLITQNKIHSSIDNQKNQSLVADNLISNNSESPYDNSNNQNLELSPSFPEMPTTGNVIEITPDNSNNYNDSNNNSPTIQNQSTLTNTTNKKQTNNNLVLPTKKPATEEITIKGNPTPTPPTPLGNSITSNNSLPAPPTLNEPYRKNDSNNTSITSNQNINSIQEKPNSDIIIKNNNTVQTSAKQSNNSETSQPENLPKRRNLADILIIAPNNSNTSVTKRNINNTDTAYNPNSNSRNLNSNNPYKVIVEIKNNDQEAKVRSQYPDAFRTNYKGKSMLQVGVFTNKEKADQVAQSLINQGLKVKINN